MKDDNTIRAIRIVTVPFVKLAHSRQIMFSERSVIERTLAIRAICAISKKIMPTRRLVNHLCSQKARQLRTSYVHAWDDTEESIDAAR